LSLSIEDFRNNLSESLLTFTFPSASKYIAGVYPIVDSLELLQQMFDSGAKIIQLRLKRNIQTNLNTMVKNACKLSLNYPNSKLFINDHWELAIENDAYGVHLGQEDLLNADIKAISNSGLHLGLSTHSYWEVSRAYRYKPSYIACGPIYPTKIKKMPWKNQGIQNLKYWARVLDIPTIGIGGINFDNLQKVKSTKCSGVSIINAIINSENPIQSFKILESSWKKKFR
jgi:hydroxymethylpyrimidine kinase/phosphomethylpyrimidine kinase/thiamine-phosphate diphosphorylase